MVCVLQGEWLESCIAIIGSEEIHCSIVSFLAVLLECLKFLVCRLKGLKESGVPNQIGFVAASVVHDASDVKFIRDNCFLDDQCVPAVLRL